MEQLRNPGRALNKILKFLDGWHWLILTLAAPLLLFPAPGRILALGVVPGLWLLAWLTGRKPPLPRTPFNLALLLLALMLLIGLWASNDLSASLPKISGLLLGFGIFFAVSRESARLGWSVALFLALGLGVAALGLLGANWFDDKILALNALTARLPKLISGLQGAESGFHPNEVAGALLWVLPLIISLGLAGLAAPTKTNAQKIILAAFWLMVAFVSLIFLLSQSRSSYLGLLIALTLMLLIALPVHLRRWALAAGALLVAALLSQWNALLDWFLDKASANSALSLVTLESRLEIWSRALYGIQDFPLTGMGMNTFRSISRVYYPFFQLSPNFNFGHAHNEFLQAALDLGLPGLVAFLALYILAFWMLAEAWKAARYLPSARFSLFTDYYSLILGLGGGLLAHLLYGLTDAVALGAKPGLLFWFLLGLIAALYAQITSLAPETSHD
ncbi:MAG: hypothetical protein OHK0031_17270 [Anaerolineales bacterium]